MAEENITSSQTKRYMKIRIKISTEMAEEAGQAAVVGKIEGLNRDILVVGVALEFTKKRSKGHFATSTDSLSTIEIIPLPLLPPYTRPSTTTTTTTTIPRRTATTRVRSKCKSQ